MVENVILINKRMTVNHDEKSNKTTCVWKRLYTESWYMC